MTAEEAKDLSDKLALEAKLLDVEAELSRMKAIERRHSLVAAELSSIKQRMFELVYVERRGGQTLAKNEHTDPAKVADHTFSMLSACGESYDKYFDEGSSDYKAIPTTSKVSQGIEHAIKLVQTGMRRGLFIITSAYEFKPSYNQRPIAIAKEACAAGYATIFVAWQWAQDEHLPQNGQVFGGSLLQVGRFDLTELHNRIEEAALNILGNFVLTIPSEDLVDAMVDFQSVGFRTIYDAMDDWQEFNRVGQAVWWREDLERQAILAADKVIAVSPQLCSKLSAKTREVVWVANGLRPTQPHEQDISLRTSHDDGRIVIGYFGHLTEAWFDWNWLINCADMNAEVIFEIIGYGEPSWVKESLTRYKNIRLMGFVPAEELWKFASQWHIGIIPFMPTALTHAVDPIKIYEYLNFGLPTIATGMPHLCEYPETTVLSEHTDFGLLVRQIYHRIISLQIDYSAMRDFCSQSTWRKRFDEMMVWNEH